MNDQKGNAPASRSRLPNWLLGALLALVALSFYGGFIWMNFLASK